MLKGTEWDAYISPMSASLECLKYCGGTNLATQFTEAETDLFGAHSFDWWGIEGEDKGEEKKISASLWVEASVESSQSISAS